MAEGVELLLMLANKELNFGWMVGWATRRCMNCWSWPRRSSSHADDCAMPVTFMPVTCVVCFSGRGGTIVPGYFWRSCSWSQSKSRKRRVTVNWPNAYCGSEVFVVTSYVKYADIPSPTLLGLDTDTARSGDALGPVLLAPPTVASKRGAGPEEEDPGVDEAEVERFFDIAAWILHRPRQLCRSYEPAILAADADRLAAGARNGADDCLVDRAR